MLINFFYLQHVYLDDQRIKGSQGCHIYGYELPQSCNLSLDDEKLSISSTRSQNEKEREASTFTAIQRAINPVNSHSFIPGKKYYLLIYIRIQFRLKLNSLSF